MKKVLIITELPAIGGGKPSIQVGNEGFEGPEEIAALLRACLVACGNLQSTGKRLTQGPVSVDISATLANFETLDEIVKSSLSTRV